MAAAKSRDVISLIMSDHREVEGYWQNYQRTSKQNSEERQRLAYCIIKDLSVHAALEEMVVYPIIKNRLGEALYEKALGEHQTVKEILYELDNMKVSDPNFDTKLSLAMTDTLEHVRDEETTLLPALQKACSAEELNQMGTDWEARKTIAPTRPHPGAPNKGAAATAANMATKPLDELRDAARFGVGQSPKT